MYTSLENVFMNVDDTFSVQDMMADQVLSRGAFAWTTDGNFSSLCPNGSEWVWDSLRECAQDGRDMASIYLGLLSILCFMGSSLP